MTRTLACLLLAATIAAPALAIAAPDSDPVERAAERAVDAKKDNKPKGDRPQQEPVVEAKAAHGDKVIPAQTAPAQTGPVRAHKHHHHHHHRAVDSDKRLHDPTDAGGR